MTVLPARLPSIADAPLPERYAAAKRALAECSRVDECKDWADRAQAMASYAKQADDDAFYNLALRIRSRAIRRCGQLLQEYQSPGARTDQPRGGSPPRSQREAAAQSGMSKDQEKTAVRIANVPAHEFEAAVESDDPPTVTQLSEMGRRGREILARPKPPGFVAATRLQGATSRLADLCREHDPAIVAGGFEKHEVAEIRENVATIMTWLDRFVAYLQEVAA